MFKKINTQSTEELGFKKLLEYNDKDEAKTLEPIRRLTKEEIGTLSSQEIEAIQSKTEIDEKNYANTVLKNDSDDLRKFREIAQLISTILDKKKGLAFITQDKLIQLILSPKKEVQELTIKLLANPLVMKILMNGTGAKQNTMGAGIYHALIYGFDGKYIIEDQATKSSFLNACYDYKYGKNLCQSKREMLEAFKSLQNQLQICRINIEDLKKLGMRFLINDVEQVSLLNKIDEEITKIDSKVDKTQKKFLEEFKNKYKRFVKDLNEASSKQKNGKDLFNVSNEQVEMIQKIWSPKLQIKEDQKSKSEIAKPKSESSFSNFFDLPQSSEVVPADDQRHRLQRTTTIRGLSELVPNHHLEDLRKSLTDRINSESLESNDPKIQNRKKLTHSQ